MTFPAGSRVSFQDEVDVFFAEVIAVDHTTGLMNVRWEDDGSESYPLPSECFELAYC